MNVKQDYYTFLISRVLRAVLTAAALQVIPICLYIGITSLDLLHPISWALNILYNLTSLRSWLVLVPGILMMMIIGQLKLHSLQTTQQLPHSRYKMLTSILSLSTILRTIAYILLSIFVPMAYVTIGGISLHYSCPKHPDLRCLQNNSIYIAMCGVWSGLYYFCQNELVQKPFRFPVVDQDKYLQIRFRAVAIMKTSLKHTFLPMLYSVPLFIMFSSFIVSFFNRIYDARLEPDSDIIFDQLRIGVLVKAWILSATVFYSMRTLRLCLRVYLTKHNDFRLQDLLAALKLNSSPFVRRLAFYDLALVSSGRKGNLTEMYALSQPGGVPHTWNTILRECENVIREFQTELEVLSGFVIRPVDVSEPVKEHVSPNPVRLRRLVDHCPTSPSEIRQRQAANSNIGKVAGEYFAKVLARTGDIPFVRFLFGPVPDLQLAALLEESQQVVWAIDAVSELASRALSEDKFGVVVNDVPIVMTMVISLRSTMEKVKLGVWKKQTRRDRATCMRAAVLSSVRKGLCKMAVTYAEYLDHLNLPPETLLVMKSYANLKIY